jgi:hypothetical protein
VYNQEQKPYGRFALAAARYFQAATAAPAPTISDKPPSMGALLGSSGGVGWPETDNIPTTETNNAQTAKKRIVLLLSELIVIKINYYFSTHDRLNTQPYRLYTCR